MSVTFEAYMEDSHLVHLSFKSHPLYSLFAIFDGHNGRKAALNLSKHLINKLDSLPTLNDNKQIQQIILSMDEEFCQSQHLIYNRGAYSKSNVKSQPHSPYTSHSSHFN